MKKFGWIVASIALVLMSMGMVGGQDEKKKTGKGGFGGKGFGGFGGLTGQRQLDPLALLRNDSVKKELEVTDEQLEKVNPEIMNAIGKVLNEKQMKRFKQIELQQRGNNAFKDTGIQKDLKLTSEQTKNIVTIIEASTKEVQEAFQGGGGGGDFKGRQEKVETIRKEAKEKIYGVLTADQRKAWRGMIGEEFKIEFPAFGGGGFGGFGKGGFGKKKDAKKDEK